MDKKIILLGYSGHSYSVIDAAHSCGQKIGGYCDLENNETNPFNLKYFGPESKLDNEAFNTDFTLFPSVGDGILRKKLISFIEKNKFHQTVIIHKSAHVSNRVEIESSVFISNGAIINTLSKIGKGTVINTGAIVEHECVIAEYCHIAPGAVLAGKVHIGANSFIGANATVIQGVQIGSNVTIGAGAVVLDDVPNGMTYIGNPARRLKK
ncbi:MAG: acetyltransferase [Crocinitomicaceae bacterium]|jgi:sugar O-acyltransferase (sialic acid O-acetyltransferase NeuD family)|tara:strand:- start:38636 stop:39262 length:627 start_codon:yes stop_codon:yes gene_type:complete